MECQFGPRRKGALPTKKIGAVVVATLGNFKKTCPARIYVKKVKKFIEYAIDVINDKKTLKSEMDKAFDDLKKKNFHAFYQERYYVQLPTAKAHENHVPLEGMDSKMPPSISSVMNNPPPVLIGDDLPHSSRLHPLVQNKIRSLVSSGETRLYAIRKQLRKYVEKDLFENADNVPDRHNLTYFPTVHDLRNHIHQAVDDLGSTYGLPFDEVNVTLEIRADDNNVAPDNIWSADVMAPHAETVTITFHGRSLNGAPINQVTKVETRLNDGTTCFNDALSEETERLLRKLFPSLFPIDHLMRSVGTSEGRNSQVKLQIPAATAESQLLAAEATRLDKAGDITNIADLDTSQSEAVLEFTNPDDLISVPNHDLMRRVKQEPIGADGDASAAMTSHLSSAAVNSAAAGLSAEQVASGGYALVQTETGALLLAKGNPTDGYHVLGQNGAGLSSPFTGFEQSSPSQTLSQGSDPMGQQHILFTPTLQSSAFSSIFGSNLNVSIDSNGSDAGTSSGGSLLSSAVRLATSPEEPSPTTYGNWKIA